MDAKWRTAGLGPQDYAEEQDRAAGGRRRRLVATPDGSPSHGSVVLKQPSNRVYAYLRYSYGGRTWTRYVGDVSTAKDRADALRLAWRRAHAEDDLLRHAE